jgi:hypothetical protein
MLRFETLVVKEVGKRERVLKRFYSIDGLMG